MNIVLDTNIFVSGIHWSGDSEKILRLWFNDEFELISSLPIIKELTRVLMSFKIPMGAEEIYRWEDIILQKSTIVIPTEKINIVKEDTDDNKFIEAAVEGKAKYIISQDNHLLKIREFRGIKILTPRQFLELI